MVSFVSRGVSVLPAVSLHHGVIPSVCWYFFCFAGRHLRLAGVSLLRRAALAASPLVRGHSPAIPPRTASLIHASMMRGLYGEECPAHYLRGHFTILSFFGATVIIVVSVGSESPWTGRPARWYVFTFSISSPVIRSPGARRGIPGG